MPRGRTHGARNGLLVRREIKYPPFLSVKWIFTLFSRFYVTFDSLLAAVKFESRILR